MERFEVPDGAEIDATSILDEPSILVIDDDEGTRRTLSMILERKGYEVETVGTSEEALRRVDEQAFNVVFLDVKLPDGRGPDLLKPLKEHHPDVDVIVFTGYASLETAVRALNEGATAYVTKPLDVDDVLAEVRKILKRQRLAKEKEAAQRRLRRSERRYRTLFDGVPVGLYRSTPDGRFLHANQALVEMLGYPDRKALMQVDVLSLYVDPQERAHQKELLEKEGILRGFEIRLRRRDGSVIWVRDTVQVAKAVRGQPVIYQGSLEDITKRKRAEEEIKEQARELARLNAQLEWLALIQSALSLATDEEEILTAVTLGIDLDHLPSRVSLHYLDADESGELSTLYPVAIWQDGIVMSDHPELGERREIADLPTARLWRQASEAPIFLSDVEEDPRVGEGIREATAGRELRAMALLPLRSGGQWIALVEFLWSEPHAFSTEERFYFRRILESLEAVVARRRAYVARRRSEARYRTVFQTTGTAMVIIEEDTTLSLVNEKYEKLSGYAKAEVEGKVSWTEAVVPEDRERMMRYHRMRRSDPDAVPGQYEFRFVDRDGEIKEILAAIDLIPGTKQSVVSLLDITERKQAKQALERQLERVSLLNEIARSIAARHDLESVFRVVVGKLEHRFADLASIWLREGESEVFSLASAGDQSRQALEQSELPRQMTVPSILAESLMGGEVRYLEDLSVLDESVLGHLVERLDVRSAVVAPLVAEGGVLGVLVSGRREGDAFSSAEREFLEGLSKHVALAVHQTQLHQSLQEAYDDLRQTQRAMLREERLRALGEMASGIAHDINNAISPIPLYTAIIGQEEGLSQRARTHLRTIETAVRDVEETVGRMRQFYREREEEDLAPVRVNRAVEQAIELTRPRWRDVPQERGYVIHLERDFEDDLPPVMGNEGEIRQAVTNLIFNAVDAMPDGGTLSLRTQLDERPPAQIVIEVSDTGIGMDEETQRRCLQPFFSTKGERGSGMGLATTYGTMQRHGGDVQVESTLGEGTTMRLLFPLRETVDEGDSEVADVPVSPLRILCVDDERMVRDALREALQGAGHSVALADGGEAGLERFVVALHRGEPFDVVITDLGMPGVTGRQVAQGVKAESPETPVILLTGWGQQLSAEDNIPAAVDLLLNKPPSLEALNRALARVTSPPSLPAE